MFLVALVLEVSSDAGQRAFRVVCQQHYWVFFNLPGLFLERKIDDSSSSFVAMSRFTPY